MTKEEEASTPAGPFACLEDLVTVECGTQTLIEYIKVGEVVWEHGSKQPHPVEGHFYFFLNGELVPLSF